MLLTGVVERRRTACRFEKKKRKRSSSSSFISLSITLFPPSAGFFFPFAKLSCFCQLCCRLHHWGWIPGERQSLPCFGHTMCVAVFLCAVNRVVIFRQRKRIPVAKRIRWWEQGLSFFSRHIHGNQFSHHNDKFKPESCLFPL